LPNLVFCYRLATLDLAGFLLLPDALCVLGSLLHYGTLDRDGFLTGLGALWRIGFLPHDGSLDQFGFLNATGRSSPYGSLDPSGFLGSFGSLHGPDFLIRSWLAFPDWFSRRQWPRSGTMVFCFTMARSHLLGFSRSWLAHFSLGFSARLTRFAFYAFMPMARSLLMVFWPKLARCSSLGFFAEMARSNVQVF
jgi:hypothetical protein